MKTAAILLVVLMSLYMVSGTAGAANVKTAARATVEIIKGKISSIDTPQNVIVVKESKTGVEKTITVNPKVIATLKVGDMVKIESKTGSGVADSVKVIPPTTKK